MSVHQGRRLGGFTMMELMTGTVIVGVLASMAMGGYQGYRDQSAILVDQTNQKILQAAVKLYAYDNNALPASLSDLRHGEIERAVAHLKEGKRPFTFLAYLKGQLSGGVALAEVLPPRYYNNDPRVLVCPLDERGDKIARRSYKISDAAFENGRPRSLFWFLDPANALTSLIEEAAGQEGSSYRHKRQGKRIQIQTFVKGSASTKEEPPP